MSSPIPRQVEGTESLVTAPSSSAFPRLQVGRLVPALPVSGPAQRSLTLQPADSPSRLKRPSTPEAQTALLPPLPFRLLPGGAIQFPGGSDSRCGPVPFTAHCNQTVTLLKFRLLSIRFASGAFVSVRPLSSRQCAYVQQAQIANGLMICCLGCGQNSLAQQVKQDGQRARSRGSGFNMISPHRQSN